MRLQTGVLCIALIMLALTPAIGQLAAEPAEPQAAELDPVELMREMGADEGDLLMFQLMSQVMGADASPLLLLMMMDGGMSMDDDIMGMLFFSKLLGGGAKKEPTALLDGNKLMIIEDGTVYRINTETMEVDGTVSYRPAKTAGGLPAELMPVLKQAREKATAASCLSNMKQLCLGALMYAQDFDETFPAEDWPEQLDPYIKNRVIYACPAAPDREIAYALNEALAAAKMADVPRPSETVMFFESNLGDDIPFGGPDAVLMEPHHGEMVTVGFVDGHCKLVKPQQLKELVERDPFE